MIRSIHVVAAVGNEASGLAYAVPNLCRSLTLAGVDVRVFSCDDPTLKLDGVQLTTFPMTGIAPLRSAGYSPSLRRELANQVRQTSIIHNHHLWMFPNLYPAWVIKNTACKLITSPHGTLAPEALSHSKWKKKLLWRFGQSQVVTRAACLIATSEGEYADIRNQRLKNPIALIRHGYEIPDRLPLREKSSAPRLLFLGRLHPIKGIDTLLDAWKTVEATLSPWELHLVGPGDPRYLSELQTRIQTMGLQRVCLREGAYGQAKSHEYGQADLFILPSRSENFGMTVLEALGHGVPAIVTHGAPWEGLETKECGWWIPYGTDSIAKAVMQACQLDDATRRHMGVQGRKWVQDDFSWQRIGQQMREVYAWVLGQGDRPESVRLD